MLELRTASSGQWLQCVLGDFDAFLRDHASCEKKAHASALVLVSHYPDRRALVEAMIELAREELRHYQQVWKILDGRGITFGPDDRDPYVGAILKLVRRGTDAFMLDRLLIFAIVEARGCERFGLIAQALEPGEMKEFYEHITRSEARHHELFLSLATTYFEENEVRARLDELLEAEAAVLNNLAIRPALH